MPESPEVAYLANEMHNVFARRTATSISIVGGRYKKHGPPQGFTQFAKHLPSRLQTVSKKGKVLFFEFSNGWYMVSRLGLTGWWYKDANVPEWKSGAHESIVIRFGSTTRMVYDDQLSYGTVTFCEKAEAEDIKSRIAPDVMDSSTSWSIIKDRIKKLNPTKKIEDVIIDQSAVVSGIGNYLKSEILYRARLAPMRTVGSLTNKDWQKVVHEAKIVTRRMYKAVGSDDPDAYEKSMNVYMKKIDPFGNAVKTYVSKSGRTTYWVPKMQT